MNETAITSLINLGAAGAVIIVTVYFLRFIQARDKDWQTFFKGLLDGNDLTLKQLLAAMQAHDSKTDRALAQMEERTRPRGSRTRVTDD